MQAAREKISNMASVAKERLTICKAKVDEKVDVATAKTHEEKKIAKERRKAKEARAKMDLHHAKAKHAAERLDAKYTTATRHHVPGVQDHPAPAAGGGALHPHGYAAATEPAYAASAVPGAQVHPPTGVADTMAGANVPAYPMGGHPPSREYI